MENNNERETAALGLLRFKALVELATNPEAEAVLTFKDVNEILLVAGHPVIVPDEINKKELEVI